MKSKKMREDGDGDAETKKEIRSEKRISEGKEEK